MSILLMMFVNFGLNSYFYPNLLQYQAGISISELIKEQPISVEDLYIYDENYSWTLDFYTKRNTPSMTIKEIKKLNNGIWMYTDKAETLRELTGQHIEIQEQFEVDYFRVAKLNMRFLNPKTRQSKLRKAYLLHINP